MSKVTSINSPEGTSITIDSDEFTGFNKEAIRILAEISALQEEFKEVITEASEKTKLKKGVLSKFFKARFKADTKKVCKEAELFENLDGVLDN